MKQTFLQRIMGYPADDFAVYLFWAMVGAFILINIHAQKRDPTSIRTPTYFKWRIWIKDNFRRVVFNLVLIIVAIRFSSEIWGKGISDVGALVIGLTSDGLAIAINKLKGINLIGTLSKREGNS